jgi:hypothetical protein
MTEVLKSQHAQYIFDFPTSNLSSLYRWLILTNGAAYSFYIAATAIELFFVVGFFTKKLDKILVGLFITFAIANLFIMGIFSFEMIFFLITLLI